MKNNFQNQTATNNLKEEVKDFFTNGDKNKMDGRDIGDEKPIREKDPEIEETKNGDSEEMQDIEIGNIREREKTERQERDIGEGTADMPLSRKEIEDEQDRYIINGENIEEKPITSKGNEEIRKNEPKDVPIG